jgi:prepilin-type N-terminal cleavage/methylation domain-containing protein
VLNETSAFTLLELLVVIAVIAILAALVLPGLNRAKSAAKKMTCMENLHQINLAVRMYADDHADSIRSGATDYHIYFSYKDSISHTTDPVFTCPVDDFDCKQSAIQDFFWPDKVTGHGFYRLKQTHYASYLFNAAAPNSKDTRVAGKPFSSARDPSRTVLVCELSAAIGLSGHDRVRSGQFNDAKNVLSFIDGHVSFIPIYWNGESGQNGMPVAYDPPAAYEYNWFGKSGFYE